MSGRWNTRNASVKRIQQELREIARDDDPDILAEAIEDNIFEWHFVIRGAWDSEFQGGIYHGRILMPAEYPFKPPAFVMLTPSGRFETGVKICLSISSHHPESWQPFWSVRSALVALIAFMQTPGNGALGSLDHPADVRRQMAADSRTRPPAYGTQERRELIAEMQQRMLDMEERSRAVRSQGRSGNVGQGTQETAVAADVDAAAPAVASPEHAPEAEAEHVQQQQQAAEAVLVEAVPAPAAATELAPLAEPAPDPSPAPLPVMPTTPADPELRQRAAVAASPAAQSMVAAAPEPAMAGMLQVLHHHSWEDRGLTYLAVLLALCIAALVIRKVFVTFSFTSDDLYSFNHVEGVEL